MKSNKNAVLVGWVGSRAVDINNVDHAGEILGPGVEQKGKNRIEIEERNNVVERENNVENFF